MNHCHCEELLKSCQLKVTRQRLLILNEFITTDKPVSALDLFQKYREEMDFATVYRILHILRDKKIIREILSTEDNKFFEISCIHNPVHPHFRCRSCGLLFCLNALTEKQIRDINQLTFPNQVTGIFISMEGFCTQCQAT